MKFFFAISLVFLSLQAYALDGKSLNPATEAAFVEASVEIELDSVEAWEATLLKNEVEVKILSHDHKTGVETLLAYGCHLGGVDLVCEEEEGDDHVHGVLNVSSQDEFNELKKAYKASLETVSDLLLVKQADLSVLDSFKVWKGPEEDDHDHDSDHDHGADVWAKVTYTPPKENQVTKYIQCHIHQGQADYACHFKQEWEVEGEPDLEDHNHDDGDHGHN